MEELRQKILVTDALPTISGVARQLLSLSLESEKGERELLGLIESDPFISGRIVGMANSPLFAPTKKICALGDAVMIIGLSRVKTIATAIALMNPLRVKEGSLFSLKALWLHSFTIAIGMRTLCAMLPKAIKPAEDMLFLSGLLHDVGYLALAYVAPEEFDAFISELESNPRETRVEAETRAFGITHEDIGAILGRSWNLPEECIEVIEGHHDANRHEVPFVMIRVIESLTGEVALHGKHAVRVTQDELESIGLKSEDLDKLEETLQVQQAQIALLADMLAG